jgi:hypothetical protein
MKKLYTITLLATLLCQSALGQRQDTLMFRGQVSTWANYNFYSENIFVGGRYLPEISYQVKNANDRRFDIDLSVNAHGSWLSNNTFDGQIKPYRAWVRYSASQFEVRGGLQKINFGSATMLRPLMWFDQMDPRDPLQLTDGVWGILGRYYFLNNANIWLWGLIGNNNPKGFELVGTYKNQPEFGGRIQHPIPLGEAGLSFHHRVWGYSEFPYTNPLKVSENRFGLDAKIDWVCGLWAEASWLKNNRDLGILNNQTLINLGTDYTFGIGNGVLAIYEHLFISFDEKPFQFDNFTQLSLFSISYPIGMFDNISAIAYYSWDIQSVFTFLNWQRQYNRISIHLMAFWNPENFNIPTQNTQANLFGGKGIQFMFVYNH